MFLFSHIYIYIYYSKNSAILFYDNLIDLLSTLYAARCIFTLYMSLWISKNISLE